jgi:membrane peptidoglycan carboxypeptidase
MLQEPVSPEPLERDSLEAQDFPAAPDLPQSSLPEAVILPFPWERRFDRKPPPQSRKGLYLGLSLGILVLAALVLIETRQSFLQSLVFSRWSAKLHYTVKKGASDDIAFPRAGPFDERLGYAHLEQFSLRLRENGFRIMEQARQSPELTALIRDHIAPPFPEPAAAGLVIRDADHALLYDAVARDPWRLQSLDEIPPVLVRTLLFIENRNIGDGAGSYANPAIDWARTSKAFVLYAGRAIGLNWPLEGGSTLATQLVKFQHSPGGRTESPLEKLHQVIGASLAAYHGGLNTRAARSQVVLEYLNTMPLGAAPGVGEVNGLGRGLHVWFGADPKTVFAALRNPHPDPDTAVAYKQALALLYSVHAPTHYLEKDRSALEARIDAYVGLLQAAGVIDSQWLQLLRNTPLRFAPEAPGEPPVSFVDRKGPNALRNELGSLLGVPNQYGLDRLDAQFDSTLDGRLQQQVTQLLRELGSREFVAKNALRVPHVLQRGDPGGVTYSFLLVESRPEGNLVRVHTDTLDAPFDVNDGMKLELGSTAKLRTLAHYLELIAQLHDELSPMDPRSLQGLAANGRDPLTRWAASTLLAQPSIGPDAFLALSLERRYSGSPDEEFFTGAGLHHFGNFESEDNDQVLSLREAFAHSTNLVFIRLMRDIVEFHEARLPYDANAVLNDVDFPARKQLLREIAAEESRKEHNTSFDWLVTTHNREAQDLRLRIRIERDAFARMTPAWRRLGFPFETLVPSYATAIGSSADRPSALATLMGIIVNDGWRRPLQDIQRAEFARGTPYQTAFKRYGAGPSDQVMRTPIARLLRSVLAEVVENGTAVRLKHAFDTNGVKLAVGGKTGSGDNRFDTFSRDGRLLTSRAVSRTAGFVFYLGDHWFGVITASVAGPQAADYTFTSSLPLAALKLLAPTLTAAVESTGPRQ